MDRLQRRIEELQRELRHTQLQLQLQQQQSLMKAQEQQRRSQPDAKLSQKLILQQHIHNKKQQQQQQQLQSHLQQLHHLQQQHQQLLQQHVVQQEPPKTRPIQNGPTMGGGEVRVKLENGWDQLLASPSPPAASTTTATTTITTSTSTLPLRGQRANFSLVPAQNGLTLNTHHRAASLPNFSGLIVTTSGCNATTINNIINNNTSHHNNNNTPITCSNHNLINSLTNNITTTINNNVNNNNTMNHNSITEPRFVIKPPPNYDEATKQLKGSMTPNKKLSIKSQAVDDVLEILIKNGELPPSAAQDPHTPTPPVRSCRAAPVFTTAATTSALFSPIPISSAAFTTASPASLLVTSLSPIPMTVEGGAVPPPPPPPPPPPHSSQRMGPAQIPPAPGPCPSPTGSGGLSSHSLFADLVMEGSNQPPLDLPLDLDLPGLEGMELGALEPSLEGPPAPTPGSTQDVILLSRPPDPTPPMEVKMESAEDVDVASWLDSLVPPTSGTPLVPNPFTPWPTHLVSLGGLEGGSGSRACQSTPTPSLHQSDPLLSHTQDQLDLFSLEEVDLKAHDLTSGLSWDRIDFAA